LQINLIKFIKSSSFLDQKGKGKETTTTKKEELKPFCTHCKKDGHDDKQSWILHHELKTKKFGGKRKQKIVVTVQQDLGSDLGDEMKITAVGVQGKVSSHAI
jgi:formylmethanofuran dehydrogenase subunit C